MLTEPLVPANNKQLSIWGRAVTLSAVLKPKNKAFFVATHRTFLLQYHRELQFPIRSRQTKLGEIECDWALFSCFTALQQSTHNLTYKPLWGTKQESAEKNCYETVWNRNR